MEKKIIPFLKNARFSGKGRQSLHIIYVMRIRKMLISYVRLDHTLYSINYGIIHVSIQGSDFKECLNNIRSGFYSKSRRNVLKNV